MSEDLIPRFADLLREHYLFQGLDEAQIAHVVTRFVLVKYKADEVVFLQDTKGDNFYIVFQGKVRLSHIEREKETHVDILSEGDYFGEEALLFNRPRLFSVKAVEPSMLLRLDRESFFELLRRFPQLRSNLSATAESRLLAQTGKFEWVGEDEVIYLIARKHKFFLWLSMLLPVVIGVASALAFTYGFLTGDGLVLSPATILGGLGICISILWGAWNWVDWGNDYYIVSNRRVLWMEKVVGLYNSRREAPLSQILSVNVSSSWLGRMQGYGNVDVRTFTGGILMRRMDNPNLFAKFVEGFQVHAHQLQKKEEAQKNEMALEEGLNPPEEPEEVEGQDTQETPHPQEKDQPERQAKPGFLREKLDTFLKVRYEQSGVITYRKHWLLLFRKIWLSTLCILLLTAVTIYILEEVGVGDMEFSFGLTMLSIIGIIYFVLFLWWLYGYVDWSNDIYQLTPDQIRDIERKPLGEELKKTAPLDSILSLEHTREGILQLAFNYGNVIINVGETRFVFRGVYNPDQAHHDVADYIEARSRRKREAEAESVRIRMVDWLTIYRRQSRILEQQENEPDLDTFPGKIGPKGS
jgi:hypothetical protein